MMPSPRIATNREAPSALLERFIQDFKFKLCITEQEKNKAYRLRHDVYCEELQYEEPTDPYNKLEYDIHDQNSIHCLIEHRRTGLVAGCVRVVIPKPSSPQPLNQLPLQTYGSQSLTHPEFHPEKLAINSYYEISRLAVNPLFRAKAKEKDILANTSAITCFSVEERQLFPLLASGLFITGYSLGKQLGKIQVFAMMEPSLPRLLALTGFHFTKVGETINFHGKRSAYYIDKQKAESGLKKTLLPLYLHIQQTLAPQLEEMLAQEASIALTM
ncbi:PEP-CTERM/exosortase system-associated acyltransferase [Vreelandella maris]|uniref:PEP-CTERM/exosortase system-associated acyltransferase n=1 Tax=Vreelandella maris TaxID=2729617 RepID=UPI0030EDA442